MTTMILIIAAGVIMISLEVFLPGGILGILGAIVVGLGLWLVYNEYGGGVTLWVLLAAVLGLLILLAIELSILRRTRAGRSLLLQSAQEGRTTTREAKQQLVGEQGMALTVLAPTGSVRVKGEVYEAVSQDGYIARDEDVRVVSQANFRLVVKRARGD